MLVGSFFSFFQRNTSEPHTNIPDMEDNTEGFSKRKPAFVNQIAEFCTVKRKHVYA